MDIYIQYDAIERAATNLRATAATFSAGAEKLRSAKALFNGGYWEGQAADKYIERLDEDIKFCTVYVELLERLAATLDESSQALRDQDAELRTAIPG